MHTWNIHHPTADDLTPERNIYKNSSEKCAEVSFVENNENKIQRVSFSYAHAFNKWHWKYPRIKWVKCFLGSTELEDDLETFSSAHLLIKVSSFKCTVIIIIIINIIIRVLTLKIIFHCCCAIACGCSWCVTVFVFIFITSTSRFVPIFLSLLRSNFGVVGSTARMSSP